MIQLTPSDLYLELNTDTKYNFCFVKMTLICNNVWLLLDSIRKSYVSDEIIADKLT